MDLFESMADGSHQPLADRLRPQDLSQFIGQTQILGDQAPLARSLQEGQISNMIFWGPPGTGKTSLARLISTVVEGEFITAHAVSTGAKDLREIGLAARDRRLQFGRGTVLFVDEVHRFHKGQQDVLLPFIERGDFALIGATTENPSYELNSALLSRCRVVVFEKHREEDLLKMLSRASQQNQVELSQLVDEEAQRELCRMAQGDGRQLLNIFEQVLQSYKFSGEGTWPMGQEQLVKAVEGTLMSYDKVGDEHYNCISAFIKSVRGSDPDAALYYLARMIQGGESPTYIARRLVILASEDIGNGDPRALPLAVAGLQAVEAIGLPEGGITLAQVATYLACAPKSNRSYQAYKKALVAAEKYGAVPVPKALRPSGSRLSQDLGFGQDYKNSHQGAKGWVDQEFFPKEVLERKYYKPLGRGFEKTIQEYIKWLKT